MKLFLASEIKNPTSLKELKPFLGSNVNNRLTYIPTAANAEIGFNQWKDGETYKKMTKIFNDIDILELEYADTTEAINLISNTKVLFLGGGFPVYLSYWLHRRKLVQPINDRVRNGMILLASSAGSMVCSKSLTVASLFEDDPFGDLIPGLGIIDYEIFPHYDDKFEPLLNQLQVEVKPLRNGEQIIVNN